VIERTLRRLSGDYLDCIEPVKGAPADGGLLSLLVFEMDYVVPFHFSASVFVLVEVLVATPTVTGRCTSSAMAIAP
jgi:hypothetical protein